MKYPLESLVARLDADCVTALEEATRTATELGHAAVEIEHVLASLAGQGELRRILLDLGIDGSRITRGFQRIIRQFEPDRRKPTIGRSVARVFREAWLIASLDLGADRISAGPVLLAARALPDIRERVMAAGPAMAGLDPEVLRDTLSKRRPRTRSRAAKAPREPAETSPTMLAQYAVDLTARAAAGQIDPVIGRDREIRQVIDVLARRRQNNPILVGEAGVGKTAVVEGLARRIAAGDVPPTLDGVQLWALDLASLQAGASLQGEFEQRLEGCIAEVQGAPIVLFIDEAHTLIGAGGSEGRGDAANLLKPALARGTLRTVAATTWAEYKQHIEPDAALTRRFQPVRVDEPDAEDAVAMLRALSPTLEEHHGVTVLDAALDAAVRLSTRYVAGRRLPDKAIAVLDTACARVSLGQRATPAPVEDAARRVERLGAEVERLEREAAGVADHRARLAELIPSLESARTAHAELSDRWQAERAIVDRILDLTRRLADDTEAAPAQARVELRRERESLTLLQGERSMVPLEVDAAVIAAVISDWTGVPVGEMRSDARTALLELPARLSERIIGQGAAIDAICRRLQSAGAGLEDPRRPLGVFLLAGPSGVGKTETAHALADALFGGADAMVVINLSEYQEAHAVSGLKGSPPGYVGYGRGGVLTEAVRRRPYSVVLLDEIEKAHPDVIELFYQVFDKGMLEDGQGVPVDFRNTLILATSNAADEQIASMASSHDMDAIIDAIQPTLRLVFPAAFLGRLTIAPYRPLGAVELRRIATLKLDAIARRFADRHGARLDWGPEVIELLIDAAGAVHAGARTIDRRIEGRLLPELAATVLADGAGDRRIRGARGGRFAVVVPGAADDRAPPRSRPPAHRPGAVPDDASPTIAGLPALPSTEYEVTETAIVSAILDDRDAHDDAHTPSRGWLARLFGRD